MHADTNELNRRKVRCVGPRWLWDGRTSNSWQPQDRAQQQQRAVRDLARLPRSQCVHMAASFSRERNWENLTIHPSPCVVTRAPSLPRARFSSIAC